MSNIIPFSIKDPSAWDLCRHFMPLMFLNRRTIYTGVSAEAKANKIEAMNTALSNQWNGLTGEVNKLRQSGQQPVFNADAMENEIMFPIKSMSKPPQYTTDIQLALLACFSQIFEVYKKSFDEAYRQAGNEVDKQNKVRNNLHNLLRDGNFDVTLFTVNLKLLCGVIVYQEGEMAQVPDKELPVDVQTVVDQFFTVNKLIADQFGIDGKKMNVLRVVRYILLTIAATVGIAMGIQLLAPSVISGIAFSNLAILFFSTNILAQFCKAYDEFKFSANISAVAEAAMKMKVEESTDAKQKED